MGTPFIIGIAGASGSGKSLLVRTLAEEIDSKHLNVISQDSYYKDNSHLPFEERCTLNYDHPDAFDLELLEQQITEVASGNTIEIPIYNHTEHARETATIHVKPTNIIILEGILAFHHAPVRKIMDMRIFMDIPLDICLLRRIERDIIDRGRSIESVVEQYQSTVRPMFLRHVEPTKRYADVIVPHGGANRIAIDLIKAKLHRVVD